MNNFKNTIYTTLIFFCCILNIKAQDIDNDGINDSNDNCAFTWNPTQEDSDGDGIGENCDCDPSTPNPTGQHTPAIIITASPSTTINSGDLVTFNSVINAGGTHLSFNGKRTEVM